LTAGNFYVAWNEGGLGEAIFGHLSVTTGLSTIPGIQTGDNSLVIYKSSTDENWGVVANGSSLEAVDRFKIEYGIDGQAGWQSAYFTQSATSADVFTASVTLPMDYEEIQYWVGYNGGGTGSPVWVEGSSAQAYISTIAGIKGGDNTLTIRKSSTALNWGIATSATGIAKAPASQEVQYLINGNELTVNVTEAAVVSIYHVSGQLIKQTPVYKQLNHFLNKGFYVLKVNNQSFKILIK
jgi:hypothetical protein